MRVVAQHAKRLPFPSLANVRTRTQTHDSEAILQPKCNRAPENTAI